MRDIFKSYLERFEYSSYEEITPDHYRFKQLREIHSIGHVHILYFRKGVESLDMLVDYSCKNVCDIVFSDDLPLVIPTNCFLGRLRDPETGEFLYIITIHRAAIDHGLIWSLELIKSPEDWHE